MALFTDSFARADAATLGASWSNMPAVNTLRNRIASNHATSDSSGGTSADYVNSGTFPSDLVVNFTVDGLPANNTERVEIFFRAQNPSDASTLSGYRLRISKTGTSTFDFLVMSRSTAGTVTTLNTVSSSLAVTDQMRAKANGNILSWEKLVSGAWTPIVTWDNTSDALRFTSAGYVGMVLNGTGWQIKDFAIDGLLATAPGQYGWGTYGDGDYGPNFGAVSSSPVAGSDAFTLGESASVQILVPASEAFSISEIPSSIAADVQASDAFALPPGVASISAAVATSDSGTVSEAAAQPQQTLTVTASDSVAVSETSSLQTQTDKAANDAGSLGEASSVGATLATSESHAQAESSAVNAAVSASDAWVLVESPGGLLTFEARSASDSSTLTDASSLAVTLARADSFTSLDLVSLLTADIQRTDTGSFTDASQPIQDVTLKSASDSWAVNEAAAVLTIEDRAASDSAVQGEASSVAATVAATEFFGFTDLVSLLLATLSRSDSDTFTDASQPIQDVTLKSASDSSAVNEVVSALTSTDLKTASELHFMTDTVAGISAQLTASDLAALLESSTISASLSRADAFSATELAALSQQIDRSANDSFSMTEARTLSAQVSASDGASLADTVLSLAQTAQIVASDAFTLGESSDLASIVAITRTDEFTLSAEVAGVVVITESPYIHHEVPLDGIVQALDLGGTMVVLVANGQIIDAVATGMPADGLASGSPVDHASAGVVLDVSDAGDDADYIATA